MTVQSFVFSFSFAIQIRETSVRLFFLWEFKAEINLNKSILILERGRVCKFVSLDVVLSRIERYEAGMSNIGTFFSQIIHW